MNICCTLVNGDYFLGAASLINSLIVNGYQGQIHVGYKGQLPHWWQAEEREVAPGVIVVTVLVETKRHLGYEKPRFMLSIFRDNPRCERLCWLDSDVVVTTPWSFISDCLDNAFTVCTDIGFPTIQPLHPWRSGWRDLIGKAALTEVNSQTCVYPNSGFVGCHAKYSMVLHFWSDLVDVFEENGGNTDNFIMAERWNAIVGDQDLLAAALMCWEGPLLALGPEGMGFNGLSFPTCHGTETPKVWQISALKRAFSGAGVSPYRRYFEQYLQAGPIRPFDKGKLVRRQLDLKMATLLARFYKR
jgi:hypothetical protein